MSLEWERERENTVWVLESNGWAWIPVPPGPGYMILHKLLSLPEAQFLHERGMIRWYLQPTWTVGRLRPMSLKCLDGKWLLQLFNQPGFPLSGSASKLPEGTCSCIFLVHAMYSPWESLHSGYQVKGEMGERKGGGRWSLPWVKCNKTHPPRFLPEKKLCITAAGLSGNQV